MSKQLQDQMRFIKEQQAAGKARTLSKSEPTSLVASVNSSPVYTPLTSPTPSKQYSAVPVQNNTENDEVLVARKKLNIEQENLMLEKENLRLGKERLEQEKLANEWAALKIEQEKIRLKKEQEDLAREKENQLIEITKKLQLEADIQIAAMKKQIDLYQEMLIVEKDRARAGREAEKEQKILDKEILCQKGNEYMNVETDCMGCNTKPDDL